MSFLNFDDPVYNEDDYIGFGKYKHSTWAEIKESDPGYLIWMSGASADYPGRKEFIDELFTVELDLMPDQLAAVEAITEELLHGDHRVHRLQGGAGYGKSYTVMEIAQRAKAAGFDVRAMANSYVASQVLAESLNPVGIESMTIARALALRPNTDGFQETYGPSEDTPEALASLLGANVLLIVDEDSMCSDTVVELVYAEMNKEGNNAKLLSVGDSRQLPSPEQDHLCEFTNIVPSFELTIPKRYVEGSTLHKLEHNIRQDPFTLRAALDDLQDYDDVITKHPNFEALCHQMISDMNTYPDESCLMLFFRRDAVAAANSGIRKLVYGDIDSELVDGENLRIMRTSFLPVRYDHIKCQWENIKFYSGTFIKAINPIVEKVEVDFQHGSLPENDLAPINVECFTSKMDNGTCVPVVFSKTEHYADPTTAGGKSFNEGLEIVKEYCIEVNNWRLYHYYRSKFVQVAYGYATTVHRTQGASVDRIYFNPADILQGGSMAPSLAYVAGTRAKKEIHYIVNNHSGESEDPGYGVG